MRCNLILVMFTGPHCCRGASEFGLERRGFVKEYGVWIWGVCAGGVSLLCFSVDNFHVLVHVWAQSSAASRGWRCHWKWSEAVTWSPGIHTSLSARTREHSRNSSPRSEETFSSNPHWTMTCPLACSLECHFTSHQYNHCALWALSVSCCSDVLSVRWVGSTPKSALNAVDVWDPEYSHQHENQRK